MDDTATAIHRNRHAVAGIGGVVAFLLFWLAADWGFFWGLLAGLVVYGLLLLVITLIGRSDSVSKPGMAVPPERDMAVARGGGAASGGGAATATAPAVTGTPVGQGVAAEGAGTIAAAPSARAEPLPPSGPTTAQGGRVTEAALPEGRPDMPVAKAGDADRGAAGEEPVAHGQAAPRASDDAAEPLDDPTRPLDAFGAGEVGQRPPSLDAPRDGRGDDLRRIRGVGPKLEALLHRLGFWHYDQIAGWSDAEVAWVDQHLEGFRGRVSRDDWVTQARALASGRDGDAPEPAAP